MFRNKKGIGTQVDWIIGMGIFMVYLSLTFIFFKPGVKPVFDSDTLQDIVKEKLTDDTFWKIEKTPIFLEQIKFKLKMSGSEVTLSPNDQVKRYIVLKDLDKQLEFSKQEKKTELFEVPTQQEVEEIENPDSGTKKEAYEKRGLEDERTTDEKAREDYFQEAQKKGKKTKKTNVNEAFIKELSRDYSAGFNFKGADLQFYTYFPRASSVNSFVLLTSEENINVEGGFKKFNEEEYLDKTKNLDACIIDPSLEFAGEVYDGEKCRAKYKVGVTEEIEGLALKKLLDLNTKEDREKCGAKVRGYECVKKLWGFPEVKDFKIELYTKEKIAEFPKGVEPPADANVYTKNYNDFILSDDGKKIPATINLMVW